MADGTLLAVGVVGLLAAGAAVRARSGSRATVAELRRALAAEARTGSSSVDLDRLLADLPPQQAKAQAAPRSRRAKAVPDAVAEVFLKLEPQDVPDDLLVAVLLSGTTEGRDPSEVARELLKSVRGDIALVAAALPPGATSSVGRARLTAASELFRRANYRGMARTVKDHVLQPADTVALLMAMALGPDEKLVAMYLDAKNRLLASRVLSVGAPNYTVVDSKVVFRTAVQLGAFGVILAHQHPSGDATPSQQDVDVTRRIRRAGEILGIQLVDHLVVVASSGKWSRVEA